MSIARGVKPGCYPKNQTWGILLSVPHPIQLRFALALGILAAGACGTDDSAALLVELRTDFVAGQEFDAVRTAFGGAETERAANGNQDYIEGIRIADFQAAHGVHRVTIELLRGSTTIVRRTVSVAVSENTALRVVIARSCLGLACPALGSDPSFTECFEGECVDPRCSSVSREFCGEDLCTDSRNCPAPRVECAAASCSDGACLFTEVPGSCLASEWCNPDIGCEPLVVLPPGDGGVDAGSDVSVDTGGPLCDPELCDDAVPCTDDGCAGDLCTATPNNALCDLEEGGTCDGALGCQYPTCTPLNCVPENSCETATCSGDMCNRAPLGSCREGQTENEMRACGDCGTQSRTRSCGSDCEFPAWGAWGACQGEGVCAPGSNRTENRSCGSCGTQTRTSTCSAACTYGAFGSYGACSGEGVCAAGAEETRSVACGDCGTQMQRRNCNTSCGWGGWTNVGGCSGEGMCSTGATQNRDIACGNCGTQGQTRTCNASCGWPAGWTNVGGCSGEGACATGATENRNVACGNCGMQSQSRTCNASCGWPAGWTDVGGCTGEGVCTPGAVDTETSGTFPCMCGATRSRNRTCNASCGWDPFGPYGACGGAPFCTSCAGPVCPGGEGYRDEGICFRLCTCSAGGTWTNCASFCESTCMLI